MGVAESCCSRVDADLVPFRETGGEIRLLVVALDYEYSPGAELTCTHDASFFVAFAKSAGVQDITVVTDKDNIGTPRFPTRNVVLRHMREVAKRTRPQDWFVWFYAGHGVNVPDLDGDEEDGFDEAFVTPSSEGKLVEKAVLLDDDFAKALDTLFPEKTRILCICDCCHSGTIVDIDSFYFNRDVYQISASQDNEEAEDTGKGGVLTKALKQTIQVCTLKYGQGSYSLKRVADGCVKRVRKLTTEQAASFQYCGTRPEDVAWPLLLPRTELLHKMDTDLGAYEDDSSDDET